MNEASRKLQYRDHDRGSYQVPASAVNQYSPNDVIRSALRLGDFTLYFFGIAPIHLSKRGSFPGHHFAS